MNTTVSQTYAVFVDWACKTLQKGVLKKAPSTRNLIELLEEYARNELEIESSSEDWAVDNIKDCLRAVKGTDKIEVIYDTQEYEDEFEERYLEAISIRLKEEVPPQERFIGKPRNQEEIQPIPVEVLLEKVKHLEKIVDKINNSADVFRDEIGLRSGTQGNLFELLRMDSRTIKTLSSNLENTRNDLLEIRKELGEKENCPTSLFSWIRSNEEKIKEIAKINLSLEQIGNDLNYHLDGRGFTSGPDTFRSHFNHILFALPSGGWKTRGWIALIGGFIFAVTSLAISTTLYTTNLENRMQDMEAEINTVRDEVKNIQSTNGLNQPSSQQLTTPSQGSTSPPSSDGTGNQTP